jgi:predicted SnoaL-like aldol condensation-catalyzing enzyme
MMMNNLTLEPVSEEMRKAAEAFFILLYVDHDFVGAMRAHTASSFVEHNPDLPNSPEDQARWFEERAAANPDFFASEIDWKTRFVHKFIVSNYLIVHYFMSVGPTDRGRMFADFWRFEGNKIVEHWDVVQPVPEKTQSGNPMW